jgi:hypothetical protein
MRAVKTMSFFMCRILFDSGTLKIRPIPVFAKQRGQRQPRRRTPILAVFYANGRPVTVS